MSYDEATKTIIEAGGGLAAIGVAWKWLPKVCAKVRSFLDSKRDNSVVNGLRTLHLVYDAMERAQDHGATRAIIFAAHNSGGIPRVDSPFYTSAVHWVSCDERDDERIASFVELQLDTPYIRMLLQTQATGFYHFIAAQEPDCMLKRLYAASGITSAAICCLGVVGNSYLYLSFARTEPGGFSEIQITELRLIAGTIKRAVKSK